MRRPIARHSLGACHLCVFGLSARPSPSAKAPSIFFAGPPNRAKLVQNGSLYRAVMLGERGVSTTSTTTGAVRAPAHDSRISPTTSQQKSRPVIDKRDMPDLARLAAVVKQSKDRFMSIDGIPSDQLTLVALKTCDGAANAMHPHLGRSDYRPSAAAADLLALGAASRSTQGHRTTPPQLRDVVSTVSEAAYAIVTHPNVRITPQVLGLYVDIQAKLSRPETLPKVLELYSTKPLPRNVRGVLEYVKPTSRASAALAIEKEVAGTAVDAAIDAKNLDATIAIIEACYNSQAFRRQKVLRRALLPVTTLACAPLAVYGLASSMSQLQTSVDPGSATKVAFAGIIAYLGFTASIGLTASVTADDHMKRVTWAPGTPLRDRWLREEERAALDKVALAWGFRETWRYGEEGGAEWEALREYIGLKGMILDRVEFMEGMN